MEFTMNPRTKYWELNSTNQLNPQNNTRCAFVTNKTIRLPYGSLSMIVVKRTD